MSDWSFEWLSASPPLPYDPSQVAEYDPYYRDKQPQQVVQCAPPQAQQFVPPPSPSMLQPLLQRAPPPMMPPPMPVPAPMFYLPPVFKVDSPRELRNKAEKQRRDKLNQSIAKLATLVPPVVKSTRKIDKIGVLRYTAHYLRAHQYVFEPAAEKTPEFSPSATRTLLALFNGFLLTITYKGLIVVVSPNVTEYLGYTELELLGKSVFGIVHEEDREIFQQQLMPTSQALGQHGELLVPDEPDSREKVAKALANEKRRFVVRFMKTGQRSQPNEYVTCHVEGSLRMSDRAGRGSNPCCQMVRRTRSKSYNRFSSGNDVVFIGMVRPSTETFLNESALESFKMEYRTRHSIDGEILDCEQRIALVTGYMTSEVNGVNAMNFIHRDEVRWVISTLKEMYNRNQLYGESCYRLMMKNGEFTYMRTRGRLDVDLASGSVTSFVCTNTVVDEKEGKHHIKMMKEQFSKNHNYVDATTIADAKDVKHSQTVEDPRQLEKAILNLVTNLPSPQNCENPHVTPCRGEAPTYRLAIIPPKKERIVSAIDKIYSVIKTIPKHPSAPLDEQIRNEATEALTPTSSDTSELAPFNDTYKKQSGSETEFDSEPAHSPAKSDFDCAPLGMTRSYDEMTLGLINSAEVDSTQPENEFRKVSHSTVSLITNGYQRDASEVLLLEPNTAGIKRPNRFDDQESTTKKKVIGVTEQNESKEESGRNSPALETFFDETVLNNHIESALDSLEEINDFSFPDLLISKDIENLLESLEGDQGEK